MLAGTTRGLFCCGRLSALALLLLSAFISRASGDMPMFRPVLVDTSACVDVANVLAGSRLIEKNLRVPTNITNIVQLDIPHTIPLLLANAVPCVVKNIVLDFYIINSQTTYERLVYGNDTEVRETGDMWQRHVKFLAENQGLAIVSCHVEDNETDISQLSMSTSTDFGFMMRAPGTPRSVHVVECSHAGAFCMVRIDVAGCINSKHVLGYLPNVGANVHNWWNIIMSMMGSPAAMMKTTAYRTIPAPAAGYASRVISGLNATGGYLAFSSTCTNEDNAPCTPLEANAYAMQIASGLVFVSQTVDDVLVYTGVVKTGGVNDNHYDINFIWYNFDHGNSPEVLQYVAGNRDCPVISEKSGSTDTYRDSNGVFKVSCIMCGINTYYTELAFPAAEIASSKTMFISSIFHTDFDEITQINYYWRLYFVASAATPNYIFREEYRQESVVEIGTVLTLKIGTSGISWDPSPGIDSIITRLECDGQTIEYTRDTVGASVTFEVLPVFSGKAILVYIEDSNCCKVNKPTDTLSVANFKVMPALIFPRAPSVQQQCVACVPGKFSGLSAQHDASVCIDMPVPAVALSGAGMAQRRSTHSNSRPFRTFVEVDTVIVNILEIRTPNPQVHAPSEDFGIEAWLDTSNITFVMANAVLIANSVFKIYDPRRTDMKATQWQARSLLAGQGSVILSINGQYTGKNAADGPITPVPLTSMQNDVLQVSWVVWLVFGLILLFSLAGFVLFCVVPLQCHCCAEHSPSDQHTHPQMPTNALLQPQYMYHQTPRTEM